MISKRTIVLLLALPLATVGCESAPGPIDSDGPPCALTSSCEGEAPPEAVCLEHLAADRMADGCGVFVAGSFFGGDDANPGTKNKPVRSILRAIELARVGRGRVFACNDVFEGAVVLPSGVDLYGGIDCQTFERFGEDVTTGIVVRYDPIITLIVEPAGAGDTGAADGVSTIDHMTILSKAHIGMLVRSGSTVEFIQGELRASYGGGGGQGEGWPGFNRAPAGGHGIYGGDVCSAATVAGGPAVVNPCEGGIPSVGGKGGDGLPDGAGDGEDGEPVSEPDPGHDGKGGLGDRPDGGCSNGVTGKSGSWGVIGVPGEGIGRLTETGWEGDWAAAGSPGTPGQGGGGGGGRRGGLAVCGVASRGGAGGGSGGAGGCGGRGGRGGGNGRPTIGIAVLHAKLTVRDSLLETLDAGPGGDGGLPEEGGYGGRGAPGGALGDGTWSCGGGEGGRGGDGGYGGPGRGGDSIGIAYLDEDQLTLEGVKYELGPPGEGGISWNHDGSMVTGEDGTQIETLRFPE
ncbi:hypothetical protein [Sorangium cellulosum]|uniref:hypothetical protein n=1 Tax=Sorangium cellulosum TaxID=56 RepID=UPI00040A5580|nr:hypothetical protein [Sorangium cellulosum]